MKRVIREIKKAGSIAIIIAMLLSFVPTGIFALNESNYKEPLVFADFEGNDSNVDGSNNAAVSFIEGFATGTGKLVAKLELANSGDPSISERSLVITKETSVDVSNYKYLTFWIKDNGTNSAKVHLIDASGNATSGNWTGNVTAGKWSQLSVSLDQFKNIDLSKITGVVIGEWNKGSYLIDDVQFTDVLAKDLKLSASKNTGTYNDSFEVTLTAGEGQSIYYTVDGSQPTISSTKYSNSLTIDESMTLKAIVVDNQNISEVYEFDYIIDHQDNRIYTPVVVQTFEDQNNFSAANGALGTIVTNEKHSGEQSLKYIKTKSEAASTSKGSIKIDFNHAVNAADLKYLIFYIKDTQGSNTLQVSLIDTDGKESDFGWRSPSTTKDKWVQYCIKVSDFNKIDKTKIAGIRIGEWNAGTYYLDDIYFDNYLYSGLPSLVPTKPEANISDGYIFKDRLAVTLKNDNNAPMYYTMDGSTPNVDSTKYSGEIELSKTTTLKTVSFDNGKYSEVVELTYIKDTNIPSDVKADKVAGKYTKPIKVTLSNEDNLAIYYTIDGSTPSKTSSKYTTPISIGETTVLKAVTYQGDSAGNVMTFKYQYPTVPSEVTASIPETKFTSSKTVELISDIDANIYYTTDGSVPTVASNHYTQPLRVSENTTFTVGATYKNSNDIGVVTNHTYIINPITEAKAPVITPGSGTYGQRQLVSMSSDTQDSKIYYTVDGSIPSRDSMEFKEPFYVKQDTVVKAITVTKNGISEITVNEIKVNQEASNFLKTDGKVIRNNYGAGEKIQLKGTNVGGWLVMEEWQCPTSAPDQKTMLETFTKRFGEAKAWELINTYQDNWFTEADFITLKEEGVNCLRLPITYFEMANLDGTLKETAFDRLDWFIEEAAKHGIYTLIDMHGAFGSQNGKDHSGDITYPDQGDFFGKEENIQKTIKLWEAIAARYNGNEWVAGYDLLNEPGGALGTEQFEVYDRIYKAVRAIDQDHIIQIQAIWEPTHLPAPTLYGWENVVYQYHFYGWDDINNLEYQKAFINSKIKYVNEDTNYNVPVFVGEFTFFTNMDSWEYGLSVFDEQGWSYTSWTYKVAGANSSWGMYTMPKNDSTNVNINTDDFETVKAKWSNFDFTRNTSIADVLSKHFKIVSSDLIAPVIEGNDAAVMVGVKATVSEILDLFIKDDQDGVIDIAKADITTDFDCSKAGVYTVTVEASDKAGNISEAAFTITVKEETVIAPDVVEKPDSSKSEVSVNKPVKTGDNENIIGDLMILGLSMIAGVILLKRRKEI